MGPRNGLEGLMDARNSESSSRQQEVPDNINVNEPSQSHEERGLCSSCGIRTHNVTCYREGLTNKFCFQGVCVQCNPEHVPPLVRKAWRKEQRSNRASQVRRSVSARHSSLDPIKAGKCFEIKKSRSEGANLADGIGSESERGKRGHCKSCGIQTHNVTKYREPLINSAVHYGVCIKCRPNDVVPSVRRAWEEKQKLDSMSTGPSFRSLFSSETTSSFHKRGLCPNCGILTHKVSLFGRQALNNNEVHMGVCIKCNPSKVLPSVRRAWEDKLKSSRALELESEDETGYSSPTLPIKEVRDKRVKSGSATARKAKMPVLQAKHNTPLSLGWKSKELHVFHHVIPFCSSTKRSKEEKKEDKDTFGGINRCVFSNLFMDDEPLYVSPGAEFMGHATHFSEGICAESFYMAARCKHKCDAQFIMSDLKKSSHIERFCHNRMKLSQRQRYRLINYGADPADFRKVDGGEQNSDCRWLRWASGKMPVRRDWYAVRHQVVLHILRSKFGGDRGYTTQKTVQALCTLISKGEFPLIVAHRQKDQFWGDALDGSGYNIFGKTITQVLLEITGVAASAQFLSKSRASRRLFHPNTELVDYKWPESDDEEAPQGSGIASSPTSVAHDFKIRAPSLSEPRASRKFFHSSRELVGHKWPESSEDEEAPQRSGITSNPHDFKIRPPSLSKSRASRKLFHSNRELVGHKWPESSEDEESSRKAGIETTRTSVAYDFKSGKPTGIASKSERSLRMASSRAPFVDHRHKKKMPTKK